MPAVSECSVDVFEKIAIAGVMRCPQIVITCFPGVDADMQSYIEALLQALEDQKDSPVPVLRDIVKGVTAKYSTSTGEDDEELIYGCDCPCVCGCTSTAECTCLCGCVEMHDD